MAAGRITPSRWKGVSHVDRIPPHDRPGPGDEIDAVVEKVTPFGMLVRTESGLPGLVRGGAEAVGTSLRLRVLDVDAELDRFSASQV